MFSFHATSMGFVFVSSDIYRGPFQKDIYKNKWSVTAVRKFGHFARECPGYGPGLRCSLLVK